MNLKVRKPFIYALVLVLLLPFAVAGSAFLYNAVRDYFRIQDQLKERAAVLKNSLLREILLKDPVLVANEEVAKGNLAPVGYQSAGGVSGTAGKVVAIGIDCPDDTKLPVYYAEDNTCFREEVDRIIPERYSAYNQALVTSSDYTGACKKK